MAYLDKNWDKLTVSTRDGHLSIDNNPAENAIRPFVVGRKNWPFSASVDGAKANGLEPYGYLREVFTRLPGTNTVEDIEALLPWQYRTENTDSDTDRSPEETGTTTATPP